MNKRIKSLILILTFSFTLVQFKANASSSLDTSRVNVDSNKEWTIKFNRILDPDTLNNNVIVSDSQGNKIPVKVTLGGNKDAIVVSPETSGYDPGQTYDLTIEKNIKSSSGTELPNPINMSFKIKNLYSDGTNYNDVPNITSDTYKYQPLCSSQNQGFILNSSNGQNVQYRIFVAKDNQYDQGPFEELTNGYTTPVDGEINAVKSLDPGTNGQKYKVIIYVRRTGVTSGAHADLNTDYDNYLIDYFRCVNKVDTQNVNYTNYGTSLNYGINKELAWESVANSGPYFSKTNIFNNLASTNQIKYYMNPNNFLDSYGKYQFLKLSYEDGITVDDLNNFLADKGIFKGHAQDFIDAGKQNNISVSYLVSHAMLETGNGASYLANGEAKYNGQVVYNFFGIGAVDSNANTAGAEKAYEEGWTTPKLAIFGGAEWLSSSYINNPQYKQDTIYKMRWNPSSPGQHQYATDISWAYNQIADTVKMINSAPSLYKTIDFDVPKYAQ